MAQSRLEKIGTIYTRVSGLLKSGAMMPEDKPIWYEVYKAFPPKLEPRYDRPAPNIPIKNIFYKEDIIRAKYHKSVTNFDTVDLLDKLNETQAQQLIAIFEKLKSQGPLDDNQIFETAKELLKERRSQTGTNVTNVDLAIQDKNIGKKISITNLFQEHTESEIEQNSQIPDKTLAKEKDSAE